VIKVQSAAILPRGPIKNVWNLEDLIENGRPVQKRRRFSFLTIVFFLRKQRKLLAKKKRKGNTPIRPPMRAMIGLHDRHHHPPGPFPPLACHRDGEGTTTKTPAMAGLRDFESLSNTNAQRSLILLQGRKRRVKRLQRTVPYKYPTKQPSLRGTKRRKRRGGEEKKQREKKRETEEQREQTRERAQHKDKRRSNERHQPRLQAQQQVSHLLPLCFANLINQPTAET